MTVDALDAYTCFHCNTTLRRCRCRSVEAKDRADDVHVYPLAGRAHETSVRCWCSPVRDEDVPAVVVHREEN